jgi:hypothetical protein
MYEPDIKICEDVSRVTGAVAVTAVRTPFVPG